MLGVSVARPRGPIFLVLAGWLAGCGPLIVLGDTESDSEAASTSSGPSVSEVTTSPTVPPPPPGTTVGPPPDTGDATTGPEATSSVFIDGGWDDGFGEIECDLWTQGCPRGEKCMPWANDGGNAWNALRCSPVATDPDGPGEPCLAEGSGVSGIDSCVLGAMCWDVDPDTLEGTCVAFCTGTPEDPMCEDPQASCAISGSGVLALCLTNCDPLLQDCPDGQACLPTPDSFSCVEDASGDMGAPGDPCEYINACDPGTFCAAAELVPDCAGVTGCCTSFCDLTRDPPPCFPGQECAPWYADGGAPPGYETVGACVLP